MKSIKLVFVATLLFSISVNAQITKGNWMVGGNASFSSKESFSDLNKSEKKIERSVQISPNIGYFFIDKLAVGGKIGYEGLFNNSFGGNSFNTYFFGPFVRYYFLKPEKLVNLFAEGSYSYSDLHENGTSSYNAFTQHNDTFNIMAGPVVYFNSSVSMEFTIQYSTTKTRLSGFNGTSNNFQAGLGFQIYLKNDH